MTAIKKGTISDKISALSMVVQRQPPATLSFLLQLLNLCKNPNHKIAEQAIGCFRDLLVELKIKQPLLLFSKNDSIF